MGKAVWQTGPGGMLAFDLGEYHLLAECSERWVRHQAFRRRDMTDADSPVLFASGNHEGVGVARRAAERAAQPGDGSGYWPAGGRAA